jgi:hypothetical protein
VSFDVFLQRFGPGEANSEALLAILKPHLVDSARGFDLRFDDGDAAIYGLNDLGSGFMVNHITGKEAWDLLVAVAGQGGMAILPVGCPAVVTSEDRLADLPDGLREDARVVHTGADLVRLIESA